MTHSANGRDLDKSTDTKHASFRTANASPVCCKSIYISECRDYGEIAAGIFGGRTAKLEGRSRTKCTFLAIRLQGRRMTCAFSRYRENSVQRAAHSVGRYKVLAEARRSLSTFQSVLYLLDSNEKSNLGDFTEKRYIPEMREKILYFI